jgi:cytochrome c oxidase subunit III
MMAAELTPTKSFQRVSTRKFMLWLGIVSIIMLFGGLTSAYIVRQGEGRWVNFELPGLFIVSTIVIVLCSITLHWAIKSVRKNNLRSMKLALVLSAVFGFGFVLFQYLSYKQLVEGGIYLVGKVKNINMDYEYISADTTNPRIQKLFVDNPDLKYENAADVANVSGSFLYAIAGLHVVHVLSGIIALSVVLWRAFRKKYSATSYEGISLCATYWHFLDGLWIYLYLFLIFIR